MNAKTRQKHDYPSAACRRSYARRTGAERGFATAKDPATNDISRGWCRLMGLAPLMLFVTTLLVVRNQRILARLEHPAAGKRPPRRQGPAPENPRRRRKTLTEPPPPGRPRPGGHVPREQRHGSIQAPRPETACPETSQVSAKQSSEREPHTTRQQPACTPECQTQT